LGISHSPEGRKIFANLTVKENLDMGAFTRKDRAGIEQDREAVFGLFPRLRETGEAAGWHAVRRRAADAGDFAGSDVAGRSCCCWMSPRWGSRRFWWSRSSNA
jgi:hypothetical protein